jgi:5-methylcytosine-specific restriction protein A
MIKASILVLLTIVALLHQVPLAEAENSGYQIVSVVDCAQGSDHRASSFPIAARGVAMPGTPPRFRTVPARRRKPWARKGAKSLGRLTGRRGVEQRRRILREEPLCRDPFGVHKERREVVASEQIDHIKPLALGGSDDRDNKQALCTPCHERKSRQEREAARAG